MEKYRSSQFQKINKALYVLGLTGAGKTTFILWLLDYEFKTKKVSGITYFEPINVKPEHSQLLTSISSTSVTSKLATFPLESKTSIVDTTGDLDTQGVETELANQLMMTNSYSHCEGVAYLMLQELAPLESGRCRKMVDLAKRIAERFKYKDGKQLESFLIMVFNNKNHWDDNRISGLIKNA
jgi:GTPase SAR1 family protein